MPKSNLHPVSEADLKLAAEPVTEPILPTEMPRVIQTQSVVKSTGPGLPNRESGLNAGLDTEKLLPRRSAGMAHLRSFVIPMFLLIIR